MLFIFFDFSECLLTILVGTEVFVTDGNSVVVDLLSENVESSHLPNAHCALLEWGVNEAKDFAKKYGVFDAIIASDILVWRNGNLFQYFSFLKHDVCFSCFTAIDPLLDTVNILLSPSRQSFFLVAIQTRAFSTDRDYFCQAAQQRNLTVVQINLPREQLSREDRERFSLPESQIKMKHEEEEGIECSEDQKSSPVGGVWCADVSHDEKLVRLDRDDYRIYVVRRN